MGYNLIDECLARSNKKITTLRDEIQKRMLNSNVAPDFLGKVCIYACGSLGRKEISETSDLDLFFIYNSDENISKLDEHNFFSALYEVNKKLNYSEPSKNGEYWKIHKIDDLLDIGSQQEDFNNSFTARLLLLLESTHLYNGDVYNIILEKSILSYFSDYEKHKKDFIPLFLVNDIKRYWYTLTLNYEFSRDKNEPKIKKYWKRMKLKYPRLLICYSTIACLYKKGISPDAVRSILTISPLERLDYLKSNYSVSESLIKDIKKEYNWFLSLTKLKKDWWEEKDNKETAFINANQFHELVVHKLMESVGNHNENLKLKFD